MGRRKTFTIEAEVKIEVSDCLPELDTQDLVDELRKRRNITVETPIFEDPIKLRKFIASLLGLHEWDYNNKQRIFQRVDELFN